MDEKARNLRIAQTVNRDFAWHGQIFQISDFVAILDGQIIAVRNNADDAIAERPALDPDPKRGMVIEVSPVVADVIRRVQ